MDERIENIEQELKTIKERNVRVEADKAWETSKFRICLTMFATYVVAGCALAAIGNEFPLRNALIPTIGYFLSTQSLPFMKRKWIHRQIADSK